MQCHDVRAQLLARRRGQLSAEQSHELDEHLATCADCRTYDGVDAELSRALETKLESLSTPDALRRSLRARYAPRPWWNRSAIYVTAAGAAGAAFAVGIMSYNAGSISVDTMVREAINDHLRILYSERPLEVVSSSSHTVKPWFAGRIDFAPVVPFEGDKEFILQGGAVAYFVDRKAAVYEYQCRLHRLSLLIFRADGLNWSSYAARLLGIKNSDFRSGRGFNTLLWKKGDLGYALVSDINREDLERLAAKLGWTR